MKTDEEIRALARYQYENTDATIQIDIGAKVSYDETEKLCAAWVQAWVWVDWSSLENATQ